MDPGYNCYVGVIADNLITACKDVLDTFHVDEAECIHVEVSEEFPEEGNTYVFGIHADVFNEDGDSDLLWDCYDLPKYPNLPYEAP